MFQASCSFCISIANNKRLYISKGLIKHCQIPFQAIWRFSGLYIWSLPIILTWCKLQVCQGKGRWLRNLYFHRYGNTLRFQWRTGLYRIWMTYVLKAPMALPEGNLNLKLCVKKVSLDTVFFPKLSILFYAVGSLSLINAIAGSYSEDLPIICIVGGPNSNDYGTNRILHHTTGLQDFNQVWHKGIC